MFALAISGSPRKKGNTAILLNTVLEPLRQAGWETELFELAGQKVRGGLSCGTCMKKHDGYCSVKNDVLHEKLFAKMLRADAIVLGSPTYFAGITPEMKAVIDRAGFVALANGGLFAGKIGAGVVAARRGGAIHVHDTLNHFFLVSQMLVPGSIYWNMGYGTARGDVESDAEALANMRHLGRVIGWLGESLHPRMSTFPKANAELEDVS